MSLSDLDNIIAKLRIVKAGDMVLSRDHNDLVNAVKVIRNILAQPSGVVGYDEVIGETYDKLEDALASLDSAGYTEVIIGISGKVKEVELTNGVVLTNITKIIIIGKGQKLTLDKDITISGTGYVLIHGLHVYSNGGFFKGSPIYVFLSHCYFEGITPEIDTLYLYMFDRPLTLDTTTPEVTISVATKIELHAYDIEANIHISGDSADAILYSRNSKLTLTIHTATLKLYIHRSTITTEDVPTTIDELVAYESYVDMTATVDVSIGVYNLFYTRHRLVGAGGTCYSYSLGTTETIMYYSELVICAQFIGLSGDIKWNPPTYYEIHNVKAIVKSIIDADAPDIYIFNIYDVGSYPDSRLEDTEIFANDFTIFTLDNSDVVLHGLKLRVNHFYIESGTANTIKIENIYTDGNIDFRCDADTKITLANSYIAGYFYLYDLNGKLYLHANISEANYFEGNTSNVISSGHNWNYVDNVMY